MWIFVLLAMAQASTAVVDAWSSGDWSAPSVVDLALRLGYSCAVTLLPAGVLIWRSDAWRSIRLVLVGAIVWTTLPAMAGLVWWIVRRSPGLMDQFGYALASVVIVVAVVSFVGPAAVALGLERSRRSRSKWLGWFAWRAAIVAAMVAFYGAARWLPSASQPLGGGFDPFLLLLGSASAIALPLELLCLLILCGSCVSAVLAGEARSRLWQCAAVGATLLAVASCNELVTGEYHGLAFSGLAAKSLDAAAVAAIQLAGSGLILLAFCSPVWSAARDAGEPWLGAPDEVFSWGAAAAASGTEPIPMSNIVAAAAGTDHALALDDHGRVGAWGDNSVGQADVPDGLSDVIAIAAGDGFSLALRSDGTVLAWGANNLGQTNVPHDLNGVTAIAARSGFALALRADGTVVAWGDGRGATPVPSGLTGVTAISAGEYHGLALRPNGTVVAWGDNAHGQSDVPAGLLPVTSISAGCDFSLALLADGTVVAWGDNSYGQLDVPVGLEKVAAISAGAFHALALGAGGDVIGWGGGGQRHGAENHPWRLVDFGSVAAGDGFSLAIRAA